MFLPTTRDEMLKLGWSQLDVILVTGDAYIDSPYIGVAVIGKVLAAAGYRVGIIGQPDLAGDDICRLGEPRLFWGVSGGCVDSMVANRTAANRRRRQDDYTPGGINDRRPDRAAIVYSNLIRRQFKQTAPIVLGGIEASLRRIAHYDAWSNKIRRSILFDAKADLLIYGMAEKAVVELAQALEGKHDFRRIRGLCYPAEQPPEDSIRLPSFAEASADRQAFIRMFSLFYANADPFTGQTLSQQQDSRFLVQNPPAPPLTTGELDAVHDLEYARELHPHHQGEVRALDTIRFAIATHRGCYGECNFCAIAVHQGRIVQNRSQASILREAAGFAAHPRFKGIIHDVGGPTANMYGIECARKRKLGSCPDKRCLHPHNCRTLQVDHGPQIALLKALRAIKDIRKVFVASGIRYDLILADGKHGEAYLRQLIRHHISGQMKVAPEHCRQRVLDAMGKPGNDQLLAFRDLFNRLVREERQRCFLTYYLIAAHPECSLEDMRDLRRFAQDQLKILPRQVQMFTPTPSTWSTLMYWTGTNPFTGKACFVERSEQGRQLQKDALAVRPAQLRKERSRKGRA